MGNYAGNYAVSLKVPRQERTLGLSAVHIIVLKELIVPLRPIYMYKIKAVFAKLLLVVPG